ncbi:hypothetical protein HELRODRAFT_174213 [Helobdella robusta]|uniref:Uncharacterized protein n=1 Tax=Helobdella robusta TaxID=6412 RepID=T1F7T2_HELRO|nr:hypothetical protein HELRODRAFT_174213 [Helobdella robusta]ESO02795.1 hypothetical protein HELRODRAFT_174213 [Helobdella robusta]
MYRITLEPIYNLDKNRTEVRCHLRRKPPQVVYQVWFYVTVNFTNLNERFETERVSYKQEEPQPTFAKSDPPHASKFDNNKYDPNINQQPINNVAHKDIKLSRKVINHFEFLQVQHDWGLDGAYGDVVLVADLDLSNLASRSRNDQTNNFKVLTLKNFMKMQQQKFLHKRHSYKKNNDEAYLEINKNDRSNYKDKKDNSFSREDRTIGNNSTNGGNVRIRKEKSDRNGFSSSKQLADNVYIAENIHFKQPFAYNTHSWGRSGCQKNKKHFVGYEENDDDDARGDEGDVEKDDEENVNSAAAEDVRDDDDDDDDNDKNEGMSSERVSVLIDRSFDGMEYLFKSLRHPPHLRLSIAVNADIYMVSDSDAGC